MKKGRDIINETHCVYREIIENHFSYKKNLLNSTMVLKYKFSYSAYILNIMYS